MRLNEKQLTAIKELFKEHFLENDHIWLFGSRVDDTKRGGDIDLYIETEYDADTAYEKKSKLWSGLQRKIGEQKIDIVINRIKSDSHLRIYDIARKEGIQIL